MRQLVTDDAGSHGEPAQRPGDLPGDRQGDVDRDDHRGQGDADRQQRLPDGRVRDRPRVGVGPSGDLGLCRCHIVDLPLSQRDPVVRVDRGEADLGDGPKVTAVPRVVGRVQVRRLDGLRHLRRCLEGEDRLTDDQAQLVVDRDEVGKLADDRVVPLTVLHADQDRPAQCLLVLVALDELGDATTRDHDRRQRAVTERVRNLGREGGQALEESGVGTVDRQDRHLTDVDELPGGAEAAQPGLQGVERGPGRRVECTEVDVGDRGAVPTERTVGALPRALQVGVLQGTGAVLGQRDVPLVLEVGGQRPGPLQSGQHVLGGPGGLRTRDRLPRGEAGQHGQHEDGHGEGSEDLSSNAQPAKHGLSFTA